MTTVDVRAVLDKTWFCENAKVEIIQKFGPHPKVTIPNLRRAANHRGSYWFLEFCRKWLDLDQDLYTWLKIKHEKILWPKNRSNHRKAFDQRNRLARECMVQAIYAYWKEMQKP